MTGGSESRYHSTVANTNEARTMTVGLLIDLLKSYPPDDELQFSGLTFFQLKRRGPGLVQMEFNEVVYRDDQGKLVAHD
jgi:hypothetical protein